MSTSDTPDVEPLAAWAIATTDIPAAGLQAIKAANREERAAVAVVLGIPACEAMSFDFSLKPLADGRYRLKGTVAARLVQTCGVTLEPMTETLSERVSLELRPADDMPDAKDGAVHVDAENDPEPIIDGRIDLGRIAYEHVASGMNPYPRKEGAALDWKGQAAAALEKENPFAVLAKLKDKK